jgi:hypothetical protein
MSTTWSQRTLALTVESVAMAEVPLARTNWIPGLSPVT